MISIENISVIQQKVYGALKSVKDPEIPVISVVDMGIITGVEVDEKNNSVIVKMTPTFVGCPAIKHMQHEVQKTVEQLGFDKVEVIVDFEKRWSSNLITEVGRKQLEDFRLSPPPKHDGNITNELLAHAKCPHCGSINTTMNSPFGATLCRALHFCFDCKQGFEQFKPL
jgi:ring-1,2-phenylacetyl-CoA epoxidase subunit PaaD